MVDRWTDGIRRPPASFLIPTYLKWIILPLALPFTTPLILGIERHRIFWGPVILFDNGYEYEPIGYFYLYVDNLVLGSCWGLLTGYTRDLYCKPPPQSLQFMVKNKLLFASLLATRVLRRTVAAGLFFEAVERQAELFISDSVSRKQLIILIELKLWYSSNYKYIAGLDNPRDNAIISACVLGGFLVGSKITQMFHWSITPRRRQSGDK
ncbi:hypothetical protein Ocin01_18214 [Orchesella cincta]|uniref:Uncharacterized protein n=1 Tax=Orchesella cincta TaxID=48709 RepID=A0A1D2M669_ORCCI|nr:hypothetical protein Ocin01_18214 [Orchesella cincta]